MVLEAALLHIKPAELAAFEADFVKASKLLFHNQKGYIEHELQNVWK